MKILVREGADKRTTGRFYVVVVQAVILFGSKAWVLPPFRYLGRILSSIDNNWPAVEQNLRMARRGGYG